MPYDKKIAIVYKSKYGCTMKYAGWLAIKLNADLYEVSDVGRWDLLKYKTIIFGSPIYNSQIYLGDYLEDKYNIIKNKNIVLFCVSMNLQSKEDIVEYNFKNEDIKNKVKFFFLQGCINFNSLSIIDKVKIKKYINKNLSFEITNLEKNMNIDRSDKHTIAPIINYVLDKTY